MKSFKQFVEQATNILTESVFSEIQKASAVSDHAKMSKILGRSQQASFFSKNGSDWFRHTAENHPDEKVRDLLKNHPAHPDHQGHTDAKDLHQGIRKDKNNTRIANRTTLDKPNSDKVEAKTEIDHEAAAKKAAEMKAHYEALEKQHNDAHHAALAKKTAIEAKVNKTTTDIDNSKEGEEAEVTAKKSAEVATSTEKAPVKDTSSPTTPPKRKSLAKLSDFAKGVAKRDDADKPHDSTSGSFDKSKTASFKQVDIPPEAKKVHKSKEVEADKVNDREEKSGAGRAEGDVGSETKKQNFGTDADISAAPDWLTGVKNTIVSKAKGRVVRGSAQSNKPGKTSDKFKKIDSEIK
jgi:hypothetical protein